MKDAQNKFLKRIDAYPHLLRLNDSRNGVVVMSAPMKDISLGVLQHVHGMIDHVLDLLKTDDGFWKGFVEVRSHAMSRFEFVSVLTQVRACSLPQELGIVTPDGKAAWIFSVNMAMQSTRTVWCDLFYVTTLSG